MNTPIIHVYTVSHDEEMLLPYFLRHYEAVAEKIFVFDGASMDGSVDILESHPKVVLEGGSGEFATHVDGQYNESVLMKIRNEAYKRSRGAADWVMIVDIDEFIHHPDLLGHLEGLKASGATLLKATGYEMVSFFPPATGGQIYDEIRAGFCNYRYNKKAVFDPSIDINYHFGCHDCSPKGNVVEPEESGMKLLHYRMLGPDFFSAKYMERIQRMHPESRANQWGTHLSIPYSDQTKAFIHSSEDELREIFWKILSEQRIVRVLP